MKQDPLEDQEPASAALCFGGSLGTGPVPGPSCCDCFCHGAVLIAEPCQDLQHSLFRCPGLSGEVLGSECTPEHVPDHDCWAQGLQCACVRCQVGGSKQASFVRICSAVFAFDCAPQGVNSHEKLCARFAECVW